MKISLRKIRGPVVIVHEPTGIIWTNQTHGVLRVQSEAEGFVVPLDVPADLETTLNSAWHQGRGRSAYVSMIETAHNVLREATAHTSISELAIEVDQPSPPGFDPDAYPPDVPLAWSEAWLQCRLRLRVDDGTPGTWEDRTGVITWGNSG